MEFQEVVRRRRMVRAFAAQPLPEDKLQRLLANAIRAPSAGHLQPWEFVVVRQAATKERLGAAALQQDFIAQAPVVVVACANTRRSGRVYGQRGVERYSLVDTAFASLLLMLTATDEGLGCCFVGAFDDGRVARVLGLPSWVRPVAIIPIGYPAERAERLPRIPLQRVLHREAWEGESG